MEFSSLSTLNLFVEVPFHHFLMTLSKKLSLASSLIIPFGKCSFPSKVFTSNDEIGIQGVLHCFKALWFQRNFLLLYFSLFCNHFKRLQNHVLFD
jgi:hypothetical protein